MSAVIDTDSEHRTSEGNHRHGQCRLEGRGHIDIEKTNSRIKGTENTVSEVRAHKETNNTDRGEGTRRHRQQKKGYS